MNDDDIILNVLNAIVHAVLALPGGSDMPKASFPQFVNALGFCTIGLDTLFGIAHHCYPVTNGPVGQAFSYSSSKTQMVFSSLPTSPQKSAVGSLV